MGGHKMEVIEMEWVATCWAVPFVVDYRTTAGANVWLRRPSWQTALFYVLLWTGSDGKFREPASRYEQVVGDQRERRDVVQVSGPATTVHLPSSAFQFEQLDWTLPSPRSLPSPCLFFLHYVDGSVRIVDDFAVEPLGVVFVGSIDAVCCCSVVVIIGIGLGVVGDELL